MHLWHLWSSIRKMLIDNAHLLAYSSQVGLAVFTSCPTHSCDRSWSRTSCCLPLASSDSARTERQRGICRLRLRATCRKAGPRRFRFSQNLRRGPPHCLVGLDSRVGQALGYHCQTSNSSLRRQQHCSRTRSSPLPLPHNHNCKSGRCRRRQAVQEALGKASSLCLRCPHPRSTGSVLKEPSLAECWSQSICARSPRVHHSQLLSRRGLQ
mmetsp:Transcript_49672/g.115945  ORF Transcript_49672/g.115945 Transcript_49672/m.115945 type:complete len:210 (+) Transcript_49672:174-803(+)